jgi:hypothetical protein
MAQQHITILTHAVVLAELKWAWHDSHPGIRGGHEEGGFILQDAAGNISVDRWPKGAQDTIIVPPRPNCKIGGKDILASFHTHPNTGSDYLQEPSETDKRAVRDDTDLKGAFYVGEFVISSNKVYLITPNGQVSEIGNRRDIIG